MKDFVDKKILEYVQNKTSDESKILNEYLFSNKFISFIFPSLTNLNILSSIKMLFFIRDILIICSIFLIA